MALIIDQFAGGGGASMGITMALGRGPDVAINHDASAIAMHTANHPGTRHYCEDVWDVDPLQVTGGQPVGLMWISPDCKHFSKAKGGKPVEKRIRALAWVALRWAVKVKPRLIILENVEEFTTWGPIVDGQPCPRRKGQHFLAFVRALERKGYRVEWRELRACDYGAPTSRKRLFLIARCDGQPIIWPVPTHGDPRSAAVKSGQLLPWRAAAECIDWSIPCPSIFERARPLKEATCRRIARGIMRYVVHAAEPFIVPITHTGERAAHGINEPMRTITSATRGELALVAPTLINVANSKTTGRGPNAWDAEEPLRTVTAAPGFAIVAPALVQTGYGEREGQAPRSLDLHKPLGTVVNGQKHGLVAAFLAKNYTGVVGSDAQMPLDTITAVDHHSLVTSHLTKLRGTSTAQGVDEPLHTISAQGQHFAEVRAFLVKYYGNERGGIDLLEPMDTVTTKDRIGLVTIAGEEYQIADIGFRILQPRELFLAQGFPDSYVIGDDPSQGLSLTKAAQVKACGNSVCPPIAAALVRANCGEQTQRVAA